MDGCCLCGRKSLIWTDSAYMDRRRLYCWFSKFPCNIPLASVITKIWKYRQGFRTLFLLRFSVVLVTVLRKFWSLEALFIFGKFLTVGIPARSIFAKDKIAKIFGQSSSLIVRSNFRPNTVIIQCWFIISLNETSLEEDPVEGWKMLWNKSWN